MLHEVDQSLRNLLFAELRSVTDGLIADESQIAVDSVEEPERKDHDRPTIHLFLHDVHENAEVRDQSFEVRKTDDPYEVGKSRRPTRVNLSFMLTVEAKDAMLEHRLLGEALGVLLRNGQIPARHLVGSLADVGEQAVSLTVAQKDQWAHTDAPKVWQAVRQPLRPFIGIVASVLFDPFETKTVKLVREALIGVGHGVHLEGANRQMDVRSIRLSAAGVVTDVSGAAVQDVQVSVVDREEQTKTSDKGVFMLLNLPAGQHRLRLEKPGYRGQEVEVQAPARGLASDVLPISVQMEDQTDSDRRAMADANTLVGTLRFADGRAAAFVPVRIGARTAVTDANGMYCFSDLETEGGSLVAEIPGAGQKKVTRKDGTDTVL